MDILKKKMKINRFDDSVNENKCLLKKYADIWDRIKNKIKAINGDKENDYGGKWKLNLILTMTCH